VRCADNRKVADIQFADWKKKLHHRKALPSKKGSVLGNRVAREKGVGLPVTKNTESFVSRPLPVGDAPSPRGE